MATIEGTPTKTAEPTRPLDLTPVELAAHIGTTAAAPAAEDVDARSRFPHESIDALRDAGMLGALIAEDDGGLGWSIDTVARTVSELSRHCSSTAMVYAMHQIQVACLVRHGHNERLARFTREVASRGLLLASATTEVGIGGDVRKSNCAVERTDAGFRLVKQAPVISYGEHADAVLATARRSPDSPPNDQVLVLCRRPGLALEPTSEWDALGFRGTCSLGFVLTATGETDDVLPDPFGDISSQTMLPVSHILWSSVWLGIAAAAAEKARRFVQAAARKSPDTTPPGASRLAELNVVLQQFDELVPRHAHPLPGERRRPAANDLDRFRHCDELPQGLGVEPRRRRGATCVADLWDGGIRESGPLHPRSASS